MRPHPGCRQGPVGDIRREETKSGCVLAFPSTAKFWGQVTGVQSLCLWPCKTSLCFFFLAVGRGAEERGYHVRAVCTALPQPDVQCPENGKSSILQGGAGEAEMIFITGHPLLIAFLALPPSTNSS